MNDSVLMRVFQAVSQYVAPAYCTHCHAFISTREPLCQACFDTIAPLVSTELEITATQTIRVFAVSDYENPLRRLIVAKNHNNRIAPEYLAKIMIKVLPLTTLPCDYLVPIPLHWTRMVRRGFNQAEIMATTLGDFLHKPVLNMLYRSKKTPFQSTLDAEARAANVQHAFSLIPEVPAMCDKHIVLVDDLMTTGSTLRAATKLILKCRPATITAVVACRKL